MSSSKCYGCLQVVVFPHPSVKGFCEKCGNQFNELQQAKNTMSKFPPRLLGRYQKLTSGEEFFTAIEEHRIYPAWMKNEYVVPYISLEEHTTILSERLKMVKLQLQRAKSSAENHNMLDIIADCDIGLEAISG